MVYLVSRFNPYTVGGTDTQPSGYAVYVGPRDTYIKPQFRRNVKRFFLLILDVWSNSQERAFLPNLKIWASSP